MQLLAVGSVALDTIETSHATREDIVGGSAVFLAASSSFFCKAGLVGVAGQDFPSEHTTALQSLGVDISGLEFVDGSTFRWHGRYHKDMNRRDTLTTCLNVFETFRPSIADGHRDAPFVGLGNIDPELQMSVLDQMTNPRIVVADTMNYWIESQPESLAKLLKRIQVLCINDEEAQLLSNTHPILRAGQEILRMGPQYVVIKRGEHGAYLFSKDSVFTIPGLPLPHIVDPTGAGDAFAGGLLGYLARQESIDERTMRQAVVAGTVMGSFAVEGFGLAPFLELSPQIIRKRFERLFEGLYFDAAGIGF